jgi:cell division protein ZapA
VAGRGGAPAQEASKSRLTLRVYGEDYPLKSSADEDYLRSLGDYVDAAMRRVAGSQSKLGTGRIAVLAAIQIADELFRLRQEHATLTSIFEDEWAKRQGKA